MKQKKNVLTHLAVNSIDWVQNKDYFKN